MGKESCSSVPCLASGGHISHCAVHGAGPKALLLLRNAEDYLKSLRSTPQRDRLLKDARALLDGVGVR